MKCIVVQPRRAYRYSSCFGNAMAWLPQSWCEPRPLVMAAQAMQSAMRFGLWFPIRAAIILCACHSDRDLTTFACEPLVSPADSVVLARTGTQTITRSDVLFQLGRGESNPVSQLLPATEALAIDLIARQRQALATLRAQQRAASDTAIDAAIVQRAAADSANLSVEQATQTLCDRYEIDRVKLRDDVDFRISWARYVQQHLTKENLSKHFQRQAARFDGSRFEIQRIYLVVPPGQSQARSQARAKLSAVRDEWLSTSQSVKDLIRIARLDRSIAVTDRGWFRGWGDLDPNLISPLLKLEVGRLAGPIDNFEGVHLLLLTARERGNRTLTDVAGDVRAHMLVHLLDYLAEQSQTQLPLVSEELSPSE